MYKFYVAAGIVLLPLYILFLLSRILSGKEVPSRIFEKFGYSSIERPEGYLVWIHGASVGESTAGIGVMEEIRKFRPDAKFLFTSHTKSSAEILKKRLPAYASHVFVPADIYFFVEIFLNKWKPDLGIFIESELWPRLINSSSRRFPILLLSAGLSDRSFEKWKKFPSLFKETTENISLIATRDESDFDKFEKLGAGNLVRAGNIKFINKKLEVKEDKVKALKKALPGKKIILFVSTHKEDIEILFGAIKKIKSIFPEAYFINIPRHLEKKGEQAQFCDSLGISFSFSSEGLPSPEKDLYIVDSMGEVGTYYELAYISFIGGSFDRGGHNPLEAALFNSLIFFGPDTKNCRDVAQGLIKAGGAFVIGNQKELEDKIAFFLSPEGQKESKLYLENIKSFISDSNKIKERYRRILKENIPQK